MPESTGRAQMHKIGRNSFKTVQLEDLPSSSVLLEALKPLESTILERGLVKQCAPPTHPLWFLAETERNVFLWRNGLSLADQEDFEFWIDVPTLIQRRLSQWDRGITDPTFSNPFLDCPTSGRSTQLQDSRYLEILQDLMSRIYQQAFELSLITRTMRKELLGSHRPIVLLPTTQKIRSS